MTEKIKEKYYRKQTDFFLLLDKIKLWPSRKGLLHGIKVLEIKGSLAELTTHCDRTFRDPLLTAQPGRPVAAQQMAQGPLPGVPDSRLETRKIREDIF